ncbi:B12-binding domain-containing radical SAM protein [Ruminiclostridium cellulolyticum]|uniref:AMP-dependent synthetase and ligase n=1 Tax=Ruminiclostridium cellulolyticum (strain ATCC 35319 / DSM 5812 / JCM 6584 / H10) TaxID=394503 RepID=B8I976_RUMCH|nr:B12-binding domain-containing radical SAM protein [Ruminiclostridium cellulolyticum]ACL75336.1 AMP-dependent synthetase and ligase [Ruminiclostridium cellulolyticum H10]
MGNSNKISRQNVEDMLPLTPIQEGMLFYYLTEQNNGLYFEQISLRLTGDIDIQKVYEAWRFVISSNEMLRTVYRWKNLDKPMQIVQKNCEIPIREYDFSINNDEDKEKLVEDLKQKDLKEKIDISSEPFRISLYKLSKNEYEMIISSYHIVYDGWSNGIILKEFMEAYKAYYSGSQPVKTVKNKYKEFIKWSLKQDTNKQEEYWKEYLRDFVTKTPLPADNKKSGNPDMAKNFITILPDELGERIRSYARERNITLATLLYCAWGILLQKYADTRDVVFGTTVSGRTPEIEGVDEIVGLFINTLPLRVKVNEGERVSDLLNRLDNDLKHRAEFEHTPLTTVNSCSAVESKEGLFDSIVVIENYPLEKGLTDNGDGLEIKLSSIFEMTNYDITVVISTFEEIGLRFIYDDRLFKEDKIESITNHFKNILSNIVENEDITVLAINMLSEEELKHILFDFNNKGLEYPINKTIHQLFEEQAEKTPDRIAAVLEDKSITYRNLNERANQLGASLSKKGLGVGDVVGVMLERSIDMLISLLAILKTGSAYLPIDTGTPAERVLYMLRDSGAKMVITSSTAMKDITFTSMQGFEANEDIQIVLTGARGHIKEFDALPIPDRSLIDLTKYKGKIGMASINNCISVQTTRGCPYMCLYCHKIWSKHHVRRSAQNIYDEIEYYYKNGITNFAVIDDCFNLDMQNSSEVFKLIIKNKIKIQIFFPNGLRGDILTPDYIDLMVEAGTRGINLSLETASPRLQKLLMKNLDLNKFKQVVNYIAQKHPEVILEMATMHGFPTETEEEAMMTLNFIKDIKWLHFPYIHILKIFPNTEMEEFALANGISKEDIVKSKDRAFHELPETLPFPKSFTRKYQASFMNDYFLSKERLKKVLPVQLMVLDEEALVQKYNAYLPAEIKNVSDIVKFAKLDDFEIPERGVEKNQEGCTLFDIPPAVRQRKPKAMKILFLDLSQHFSSHSMLYKVAEQPIGHIYLLTYLKQQFGEKIDGRIYKSGNDFDSYKELKELVEDFQPDLIGIRTLTYFREFFHETVSLLRQWGIDAPVIAGGPYASSDYDTILKDENISLTIQGEGEYTLEEIVSKMLVNNFKLPSAEELRSIKGIAFAEHQQNYQNKSREVILLDEMGDSLDSENTCNLNIGRNSIVSSTYENSLAYVMYTSGSTGKPKGVMIGHRQVNNCIFWMQDEFKLSQDAVIVQRTNLTFDPSVWEIFWPLYIGAKVKLITAEQAKDAGYLLDLMAKDNEITMMYCPASLVTGMTYMLNARDNKPRLRLPWLLIGAEPIGVETVKDFYRCFEGNIVNTYGPTECTINNTYYHIHRDDELKIVPIGRPVANNKIYILSKDLQAVPINVTGEIFIAGDSVGIGYINNPEKTMQYFIENPFEVGKLYKTGDVGRWLENGCIEILGRVDEQVKIRGYRIEPGDIQAAMLEYNDVKESVVIVRDSKKKKTETKVCKLCGLTDEYPGVNISDDGVCDICQNISVYKGYADKYFKGLEQLDKLIKEKNKDKQSKYDCLLLYSGGRGAANALYHLVDMGYNVLTITYDNGYFTKSDIENIKRITTKLGIDNIVLTHKNTDKILKESCKHASTVCRGCFHISSSLAAEYAYKNNIKVVVGATLSRGQILDNKLYMFYRQGISDVEQLEKELLNVQKSARDMDKDIFDHMEIDVIEEGTVYDTVKFVDFYRFCDMTNQEIIDYLSNRDEYWKTRKDYAIYSTNCPIKQVGDRLHLIEKGYHYYGAATSWEKRIGHISLDNLKQDLNCNVSEKGCKNFLDKIQYEIKNSNDKLDSKYICAYYTADKDIEMGKLKEHLEKFLPSYMLPSYFVQVDSIPLTSNGKLDKDALPVPNVTISSGVDYVAPENEVEEKLAEVWQKVLGMDKIGTNDNFFEIGGNSILLIQLQTQIERIYPGKVSITDLFAYTTVSKLAELIETCKGSNVKNIQLEQIFLPDDFFIEAGGKEGAVFKFNIMGEILEKLKQLSKDNNIGLYEVMLSVYIYVLSEISGLKKVTIQTDFGSGSGLYQLEADLSQITGFEDLFKLINTKKKTLHKDEAYQPDEIKAQSIPREKNSVIPLIYSEKSLIEGIKSSELFDIAFGIDESDNDVTIACEYRRGKFRKDKIKELVNRYAQLLDVIADSCKV